MTKNDKNAVAAALAFLWVLSTIGGFLLASWVTMIFAGIVADDIGIISPSYFTSMVIWLGLILAGSFNRAIELGFKNKDK